MHWGNMPSKIIGTYPRRRNHISKEKESKIQSGDGCQYSVISIKVVAFHFMRKRMVEFHFMRNDGLISFYEEG